MNRQPFYHHFSALFTGTRDVSQHMNSEEFKKKLQAFLIKELRCVVRGSVEMDDPCTAEPGDPADLL